MKYLFIIFLSLTCLSLNAQTLTATQIRTLVKLTADSVRNEYKAALQKQINSQSLLDGVQNTKIKLCQDTIRMIRNEIVFIRDTLRVVRDSLSAIRPVYFSEGFTFIKGKDVDTLKNTSTVNYKALSDRQDSASKAIAGKTDTSYVNAAIVALGISSVKSSAFKSEKILTDVDIYLLKSDMDKIRLALQTPIIILK